MLKCTLLLLLVCNKDSVTAPLVVNTSNGGVHIRVRGSFSSLHAHVDKRVPRCLNHPAAGVAIVEFTMQPSAPQRQTASDARRILKPIAAVGTVMTA
jgi:hypothetical protein